MAASTPPVGLDHPTTVPENFEPKSEPAEKGDDSSDREREV